MASVIPIINHQDKSIKMWQNIFPKWLLFFLLLQSIDFPKQNHRNWGRTVDTVTAPRLDVWCLLTAVQPFLSQKRSH